MVRWILISILVVSCFVRYLYVLISQIQVDIGDEVTVTGVIWDGKIRVDNIRLSGRVINKSGDDIYLEEAQITRKNTPIFFRLRVILEQKILNYLPGDSGGLASGILLGGNRLLSYDTRQIFVRDGLSHIIAASGYNVVMVSGWLAYFGRRIKYQKLMILSGLLGTILYMLLAGLSASVIRAGIMSIMSFTALVLGRKSDAIWSLFITAVIMILWNPWYLLDIGFQLSIMATLGVLVSTASSNPPPNLGGGGKRVVLDNLKLILYVQLFTIPLILHHFGRLSLIAPLANLMVVWAVPFIMQLTAVGLIFGPVLYLAWPLLVYMMAVASILSKLPFASMTVGTMSWVWVVVWYLVLAIVYNRFYVKRQITSDYR